VNIVRTLCGCGGAALHAARQRQCGHPRRLRRRRAGGSGTHRCGLADIRQLWLDQYQNGVANDGYGAWLNTAGTTTSCPPTAGHAAIAGELARNWW